MVWITNPHAVGQVQCAASSTSIGKYNGTHNVDYCPIRQVHRVDLVMNWVLGVGIAKSDTIGACLCRQFGIFARRQRPLGYLGQCGVGILG